MTIRRNVRQVRSAAYQVARGLGWVEALLHPRPAEALARRAGRVALGRLAGQAINDLFRSRR